jgi:hypothetical protein
MNTTTPPGTPALLAEPIPLAPILREIQLAISYKSLTVRFLVAIDGTVSDCDILSVDGKPELRGRVASAHEERLCSALEKRRYDPPHQKLELILGFGSPHLSAGS